MKRMWISGVVAVVAAALVWLPTGGGEAAFAQQASFRRPVVLSIAPDTVDCANPDDPDRVEDVQINGLCFFNSIVAAYLTTSPDSTVMTGRIDLQNVINVTQNTVTATVPIAQLNPGAIYYVYVVRRDPASAGGGLATSYGHGPNLHPFGYDVTFRCAASATPPPPVDPISVTRCQARRTGVGRYQISVDASGPVIPNQSIVVVNGQPCQNTKYPSRFINPSTGRTTRINCGGLRQNQFPLTVQILTGTQLSTNTVTCTLP
jgi:hypothetical protein